MDSQGHGYVWADEVNQEAQEQEPDNFDDLLRLLDMVSPI